MAYATFDGHEIPKVYNVTIDRIHVGERARTASGLLREDSITIKRQWTLHCHPVPKYKVDPLLYHLESTLYAEGAFWMYGMGDPVLAKINSDGIQEQIVAVADDDGAWHKDGRQLTITVEEV